MDAIRDLIAEHSPKGFWVELVTRQEALYSEAYAYAHNPALWTDHEALTIYPLVRRGLFESAIRKAAQQNGMKFFDLMHGGDNYPYVLVKTAKLIITAHHVAVPSQFVRVAESRKQNAAVNKWSDYYIRQELLTAPLPDLKKSGRVNIHLLHGQIITTLESKEEQKGEKKEAFLQVAVPDAHLSEYRKIYNVSDLLQFYVQRETEQKPDVRVADRAIPRVKKSQA